MAYRIQNIDPLDLRPSTGVGVALPFNSTNVFRTVYTTQEQLKYNLINFILTEPGERLYSPDFGLGLRRRLFEQLTDEYYEGLRSYIKARIEAYFTNIELQNFEIIPATQDNSLHISFTYTITTTGLEDNLTIKLENV